MKIAFVLPQSIHYYYYDQVVRLLHAEGHEIRIVSVLGFSDNGNKSSRALVKLIKDEPDIVLEEAVSRRKHRYLASLIRGLRDYANFVRSEHPTPHLAENWVRKELSPKVVKIAQLKLIRNFLATKAARMLLTLLESLIPQEEHIVKWLKDFQPHVVFASPFVFTSDIEVDYTKAAQSMNIPVVASLLSWDNLTSKGTYKVKPDALFVWNQNLADEAVQIHDIEPRRIFVTGAPVYDPWFDLSPSIDRSSFCAKNGLDPLRPYVLYLCSSKSILDHELELIKILIEYLGKVDDKHRPTLVVRPHPFKIMQTDGLENNWVRVFPKGGQRPDTDDARSLYYDMLYYSVAVIGINTTGFLEAAILDKPCLTLATSLTSHGQEMRAHFKHLMDAGYIQVATDYSELIEKTIDNVNGLDIGKENRAKFIRQFIRPHGLSIPASVVMVRAILSISEGKYPNGLSENMQ